MTVEIAPNLQKMVGVQAPFIDELSEMAMVKIIDMKEQTTKHDKIEIHQKQSNAENHK